MKIPKNSKLATTNLSSHKKSFAKRYALGAITCGIIMQMPFMSTALAGVDEKGNRLDIGDLTIYQAPKEAGGNVMMMVDVSGSMGMLKKQTYDRDNNLLDIVFVDSVKDDAGLGVGKSCVSYRTAEVWNDFYRDYEEQPIWEDNNGYGVIDTPSATIGDRTINYELTGCFNGEWSDQEVCKTVEEEVYEKDSNGDWILYRGRYYPWKRNYGNFYTRYRKDFKQREECTTGYQYVKDESKPLTDGNYDRISKLKKALITALSAKYETDQYDDDGNLIHRAGDYLLDSKNIVGLGKFSGSPYNNYNDSRTGEILVEASELTDAHRIKLIEKIIKLNASGGTPSANAYAEAAAYMKGNTTKGESLSGFSNADKGPIRNANNYIMPGTDTKYQCYGKGIYFLTDGVPNFAYKQTLDLMQTSIKNNNFECENGLANTTDDSGWSCIGAFAKALRVPKTDSDYRKKDIRTATVGFGSVFQKLREAPKKTIITENGKRELVIDCNATKDVKGNPLNVSQDARNLCLWGAKKDTSADTDTSFGGGSFTAAKTGQDITDSILAFLGEFGSEIGTLPAGTIAVPRDPYRSNALTPYAYLLPCFHPI